MSTMTNNTQDTRSGAERAEELVKLRQERDKVKEELDNFDPETHQRGARGKETNAQRTAREKENMDLLPFECANLFEQFHWETLTQP